MKETVEELIEAARAICGEFALHDEFLAGGVGAAIRTTDGHIYTGESASILAAVLDSARKSLVWPRC